MHLTQTVRDGLLDELTEKQQNFIKELLTRGRKTLFANVLAKEKATVESDNITDHWELIDYLDAGADWRTTSNLYCDCGRKLRNQYILLNNQTAEVKKFGVTHFEEHTGIPVALANKIKQGITKIDYELDELLVKISRNWTLEDAGIHDMPKALHIPEDIQTHLDLDLPLLERQVSRLRDLMTQYESEQMARFYKHAPNPTKAPVNTHKQKKQDKIAIDDLQAQKESLLASEWWEFSKSTTGLIEELQLMIVIYIKHFPINEFEVNALCETLVTDYGAPNDTFATGRYKMYPEVVMFLDDLVNLGKLQLKEKHFQEDRRYRVTDPFLVNK